MPTTMDDLALLLGAQTQAIVDLTAALKKPPQTNPAVDAAVIALTAAIAALAEQVKALAP